MSLHALIEPLFTNDVSLQVSAGVAWNVRTGQLVGLVDSESDLLDDVYEEGLTLADKVLQFMARSITTSWSMPVAYYTYKTSGHERLMHVFPKVRPEVDHSLWHKA